MFTVTESEADGCYPVGIYSVFIDACINFLSAVIDESSHLFPVFHFAPCRCLVQLISHGSQTPHWSNFPPNEEFVIILFSTLEFWKMGLKL